MSVTAVDCTDRGSPPHMRGKDPVKPMELYLSGITPAHAGKSAHVLREDVGHRDHPRTCGEKQN